MNKPLSLRAALVFAVLALLPLTPWMSKYYLLLAFDALLFGAVAMSLDLLIGYTGLVSFGHAAFFGLGAYAAAVLLERGVTSIWLSPWKSTPEPWAVLRCSPICRTASPRSG